MRSRAAHASLILLAAWLMALLPAVASAQEQSAMDRLLAEQDSLSAVEGDSATVEPAGETLVLPPREPWWDPLVPTVDARLTSDLSRVVLNGGIEAPVGQFVPGWNGRARLNGTDTSYRQFDRNAQATTFNLDMNGPAGGFGEFEIGVLRNTSYDENRIAGRNDQPDPDPLILEHVVREVNVGVTGGRDLGSGLRAAWGVRGDIEDVDREDKGVANDRSLLGGAVSGLWGTRGPWHDFSARYGYDRRGGERALRDMTGDALTERDTLWARGQVNAGLRLNIDMDARRTAFAEDRLDFQRNENGVVDTLNVIDPVGDEHESTWENSWNVDLRSRPLPRLAANGSAARAYGESRYTLSRAGLVQLGRDELMGEAVLRYAEAGSLRVRYTYMDRYNNRRPRGDELFRGEEARVSQRAEAAFRQRASELIDIHLDLQQTLDQNVNQNPDNLTDSDRLVTRADLRLISEPWRWFQVEAAGAYSVEEEINIDASRVNSNQVSNLYEVRGNFVIDPDGGWRFIQNCRMQIRLIDRVVGIANDKFNKQGQWDTRVEYRFANGVFTDAQYIVDYRRNGDRDEDYPDDEVYIYRGARRDHRLAFGVRIPVGVAEVDARTERGFLRDDSGFIPVSQDRGKIALGLRGNWQFWNDRGMLTLNGSKILQYGPTVREEVKDYWVMNTSVRFAF